MYQFDDCKVKSPGLFLLDENSLNREALAPNSIRITRATLKSHDEVPVVESTNMGPVMDLLFSVINERPSVTVYLATEESVIQNKPVRDRSQSHCHQLTRIKVESVDSKLLFDHDFDSGDEVQIFGNKIRGLVGGAGVLFSHCEDEPNGPFLIVEFMDNPKPETYFVRYVQIECKDAGLGFEYHQVFRTPENHS